MMRRRRARGESDGDGCFTVILLFLLWCTLGGIATQVCRMAGDLRRIADAVAVYAPPAEPVREGGDDG